MSEKILLFDKWDFSEVQVKDISLKRVININPVYYPHSFGRHAEKRFAKEKVNIVERLANNLMHYGKIWAKNTGRMAGKKQKAINIVKSAFEMIYLKTKKNPIQVLVDEVRKTQDFTVYADMRLAGVGMVGVVHSSSPIDAVQRLVERIDIGMVPRIVDTVIFLQSGQIKTVYELNLVVKVPTGMTSEDLARPVVEVRNFETKQLEYEIYMYGDEKVVVPVGVIKNKIQEMLSQYDKTAVIEIGKKNVIIRVNRDVIGKIIGKGGENIEKIEKEVGKRVIIKPKKD